MPNRDASTDKKRCDIAESKDGETKVKKNNNQDLHYIIKLYKMAALILLKFLLNLNDEGAAGGLARGKQRVVSFQWVSR